MYDRNDYIAVFDSGVGGISVLRHLVRELPNERFLYFGDSANAPYGVRPTEEIRALTFAAAERLLSRNTKALVLACNTATAAAAKALRLAYPDTIIIGIEPALKPAATRFPGGTVGILATPATLREGKLERLIARHGGQSHVVKLPAPGLVELVEHGKADTPETEALLREILEPWKGRLDGLVLGCTHYPFVEDVIRRIMGDGTVLFDGGEGTARQTRRRLEESGLLREEGEGEVVFENSANSQEVINLCEKLLGR